MRAAAREDYHRMRKYKRAAIAMNTIVTLILYPLFAVVMFESIYFLGIVKVFGIVKVL